jgi:cation diffusion facilitator CzcD-associated flavoprotein CzcO
MDRHFDTIIIGAGISGLNAAYRLQTSAPPSCRNYRILESRTTIGGTWDLFRYPGVRSDSDVFTFGFPWSPWQSGETLATGDQIRAYLERSTREQGIDQNISYRHEVVSAEW